MALHLLEGSLMPRPGRIRTARMPALAGIAVVLLAGCVPEGATLQAREVNWLYQIFLILSAVVFVLVMGLLGWSIVRYRGAPGRDIADMPPQIHGNLRLEVAWWALPTLLVVVLAILSAAVLSRVDARSEDALEVEVQGFQWGWRFTYLDADVTVIGTAYEPPTIFLPTDRTVAFIISSQDVIHSFSVPPFLVKRDAIPGRENRLEVLIEEAGTYSGQCGEFCGLLHAYQRFSIEAVETTEFEAWLAEQPAGDEIPEGGS